MSLSSQPISHDRRPLFCYDAEASYPSARHHKVKFSIELPGPIPGYRCNGPRQPRDVSPVHGDRACGACKKQAMASSYENKQVTATVTAGQTQSSQAGLTQVQQSPAQPSVDYVLYGGWG